MWIKSERIDDDEAGQSDRGNQSSSTQDQAGPGPGSTLKKTLLHVEEQMQAEGEVVEIAGPVPSPKRTRPLHVTQKVYQCHHCDFSSILASIVRNHLKTHGRNLEYKCNLCNFSSSQKGQLSKHMKNQHFPPIHPSTQVNRAEDHQVKVFEDLNQPMDVESTITDVASGLDKQQSKEILLKVPDNPRNSRNETDDVIYCRRCFFWSRSPENFHKHLRQCSNGFSCSACAFSGTRLNVLHHIRECIEDDGDNAHFESAVCFSPDFTLPDNKYVDFRQNIGATPMQYGFANPGIRVASGQIGEDAVWDPMAFLSFNPNEQQLEENERNFEKEKDGLKIKIEESFRQMGKLEKELATKNIEYNEMERRVAELKDNASNIDQKKVRSLNEKQGLVTQKLHDAVVLKHQAEMAYSKKFEEVKILMVHQVNFNYSKEAGKSLEEAERELERLEEEVEQKCKNWTAIFEECGEVSRQLVKAKEWKDHNIDFVFFLNNSLGELNSTIDNLKGQTAALKESIQKLIKSRYDLNEAQMLAQLSAQLKNQSKEFGRKEIEWIQSLRHQFSN